MKNTKRAARVVGGFLLALVAFSLAVKMTGLRAGLGLGHGAILNEVGITPDVTLVAADGFAWRGRYPVRYRILCFYWLYGPASAL